MLELEGKVDFFVDEDQNRIGRQLMGRPIVAPAQVPAGARGVHPDVGGRRREDHRALEATTGRFSV